MKGVIVDIGSNSIRAMEAELADSDFGFFDKRVYTTRLAEGLLETGRLSEARTAQSLAVLRMLKAEADQARLPLFAYATSAVRDAANREAFLAEAETALGCRIDVLSGEREARYAFLGASGERGGLIDIGGGSTQIITRDFMQSFPLGCVRARDVCRKADSFGALYEALLPLLNSLLPLPAPPPVRWTGVGGTITTLGAISLDLQAYDRGRVNGSRLSRAELESTLCRLARLGPARSRHPLLAERHDVILPGGAILLYLMNRLSIKTVRVSDADGMEGYAREVLKSWPPC